MTKQSSRCLHSAGLAVIAAMALLGASAPGLAQDFTAEQRAACTPDAFRLCASEIPNVAAIAVCMRKNRGSLSSACKAVFPK